LPFAVLLVLWACSFPISTSISACSHLSAVWEAGVESIEDGSLPNISGGLLRVTVGTVLALVAAIPLGIAMGVSHRGVDVPHAVVSVYSPCSPALMIHSDTLVRLRLRRDYRRDLHRSSSSSPTTRCSASRLFPLTVRNAAPRSARAAPLLTEVLLPGALPTSSPASNRLGFAWRGLIAADSCGPNVRCGRVLSRNSL